MKYTIHGDKIIITESIRNYISSKLNKLNKYIKDSEDVNANVLVKIRGHEQIIEITIPIKHSFLRTETSHNDLYAAIDLAIDKLETQIRKNKSKMKSKMEKDNIKAFNIDNIEDCVEDSKTIIKRKKLNTKPMSEDEAILEMNLVGHDFYIFKNSESNKINVLYKRKDGDYGIIETL